MIMVMFMLMFGTLVTELMLEMLLVLMAMFVMLMPCHAGDSDDYGGAGDVMMQFVMASIFQSAQTEV